MFVQSRHHRFDIYESFREMGRHGHLASVRSSQKPKPSRPTFYIYAICCKCGIKCKASSSDGAAWSTSTMQECSPAVCVKTPAASAGEQVSHAPVTCQLCTDDTTDPVISCPAGHQVCAVCFNSIIRTFNFTNCKGILPPMFHHDNPCLYKHRDRHLHPSPPMFVQTP